MLKAKSLLITVALIASGSAAAENAMSVGGSLGGTELGDYDSEVSGKVYGAFAVSKYFAVEAGYARLKASTKFYGVGLDASDNVFFASPVGRFAFNDKFSVFGKANLAYNRLEQEYAYCPSYDYYCYLDKKSENEFKIGFGLGGEFALNKNIAFRAEYETYASDVKFYSAGARYSF